MKAILKNIFHNAGGLRMVRWQNAARNRMLMYHNFQPTGTEALIQQCEHILRYYKPVSLDEVGAFVRDGKRLPNNSVAITVDDGYRDFYLHAYPVFRRHNIPATVFLMTDFLDRREWPWWDRLQYALSNTPMTSVRMRIAAAQEVEYELGDPASRNAAFEQTVEALKLVTNTTRLDFIAKLPEALGVAIPSEPPPALEPMTWDEVREMATNGISFGAHTKSHPILASLESDEQLRDEIEGSKLRIQEELGSAPLHFSYPNGRNEDISKRVRSVVEQARFFTAVSTEPGWNVPDTDPYQLKRLPMEAGVTTFFFRQQIAGFRIG